MAKKCLECEERIQEAVFQYSMKNFNVPLCIPHQHWIYEMQDQSTEEAISLYFALRSRGVPAELEKFDGYKTIDIAVTHAKVNIEVDGQHHNFQAKQALADLKRTYHSFLRGYLTLRIPNSLVCPEHLEETADYLTGFLQESRDKNNRY